jgi:hypothetical protein
MEMTLFGMTTETRLEHPSKARPPMEMTRFGMTTEAKLVQFWKAP